MARQNPVVPDKESVVNDQIDTVFLGHEFGPETFAGTAFSDEGKGFDSPEGGEQIEEHIFSIGGGISGDKGPGTLVKSPPFI
jgi:hypothetical protein